MTATTSDLVRHPWVGPPFFAWSSFGRRRIHIVTSLHEQVGMADALLRTFPEQYAGTTDADFLIASCLCGGGIRDFRWVDAETDGEFCDDCLLADMSPCVYRVFDILGRLLYIGSSENPLRRLAQHRKLALWWHLAADWTVEPHPNVQSARRAEADAIVSERPWFNLRGITAPSVTGVR